LDKPRRGAVRRSEIPPQILRQLNEGSIPSASLAESLAVDFQRLLRHVLPSLPSTLIGQVEPTLGVVARMRLVGRLLAQTQDRNVIEPLARHPSDTVRGWAAYAICEWEGLSLLQRLEVLRPLADDSHYGVREWAWCAIRPELAKQLDEAIRLLEPWTVESSANLRRFATECTRPRGVWCAHIDLLKREPVRGLPLLEPLRSDPAKYVQDSVANWLNDAAKSQPEWVIDLCRRWRAVSPTPATSRICQRAQRSLKP